MKTIQKFYRVDRRRISMIRFILEAYEGVAVPTTLDAGQGLIVLSIAPGCEGIVEEVMMDLGRKFLIEPCSGLPAGLGEHIYELGWKANKDLGQ